MTSIPTGRKWRINLPPLLAVLLLMPTVSTAQGDVPFLIPGVSLAEARLEVGAWCSYRVIDQANGVADTTVVYFAVAGEEGDGYWVEVESGPMGGLETDRDLVRALISSEIRDLSPGDSLYHYIEKVYIKKGIGPVEPADPSRLRQLPVIHPTSDNDWTRVSDVTVTTPMGRFTCNRKDLTEEARREIPTGGLTLIKHDKESYKIWTSETIPLFELVKCEIERERESTTVPKVRGIPDTGKKVSRTTAELTGFGFDAEPRVSGNNGRG